jgi:hypothetical protein
MKTKLKNVPLTMVLAGLIVAVTLLAIPHAFVDSKCSRKNKGQLRAA